MRADTVFDAASLTKILAVWSAIGALWEEGKLDLDVPFNDFWPEVDGHPLGAWGEQDSALPGPDSH
ncbi:serine hydrolase [Streptomyces scabiei]|nr:serine hydrolase [Streptomyces scabiei]